MRFWQSVGVLASGTALGHGITAATLPILTRMYTPEGFGVYAQFTAVVGILSVAACLRYEIAISLPNKQDDAFSLLKLSLTLALAIGILLYGIIALLRHSTSVLQDILFIEQQSYLIPLAVTAAGILAALQNWSIRTKDFSSIAQSRVFQSGGTSAVQVVVGINSGSPTGLVIGYIVGIALGGIYLAKRILRSKLRVQNVGGEIKKLCAISKEYSRYFALSTPEALLNSTALHVPVLLIAGLGSKAEAGHILLAMSLLHAPMALIGSAIAQVFLSRAADEYRRGELDKLVLDTVSRLVVVGVGPLAATSILATLFVPVLFGAEWAETGHLILWMAPWFVLQFLASPLAMVLHITGHQKQALFLQGAGLTLRVGGVLAAYWVGGNLGQTFAVSNFIFYAVSFLCVVAAAGVKLQLIARRLVLPGAVVAAWVGTSLVVVAMFYTVFA